MFKPGNRSTAQRNQMLDKLFDELQHGFADHKLKHGADITSKSIRNSNAVKERHNSLQKTIRANADKANAMDFATFKQGSR